MPNEERKTWEKEQRRSRITDIAENIFFKKSLDTTTIEEIATAAGYKKRTIYLYFDDKEELFLAVVLRGLKLLKSQLEEAFNSSRKDDLITKNLGKAFCNFSLTYNDYFNLIMVYESRFHAYYNEDKKKSDDSFLAQCRNLSIEYGNIVIRAIEKDIKNKKIKTSLKPKQLMLLMWGQVFGVMQIVSMRKYKFHETYSTTPEKMSDQLIAMIEKSLLQ